MNRNIALVKIQGGLGNQLFQFVLGTYMQKYFNFRTFYFYPGLKEQPGPAARACQLEDLCNVTVLKGWRAEALNLFSLNRILSAALNRSKVVGVYSDVESNCIALPEHYQFDSPRLFRRVSLFRGSWHNLAATKDVLQDVKSEFCLRLEEALSRRSTLDSFDYKALFRRSAIVHVRLGDAHDKLESDYYKRAFAVLYSKYPGLVEQKVCMVSDQPETAKRILSFLGSSLVEIPFHDPVLVLSALAIAKYKILSHSTLSLWGALLTMHDDRCIYPLVQKTPSPWWREIEEIQGMELVRV